MNDHWLKLLALNRTLMWGAAIENIDLEDTCFAFTGDPVEDEMFLVAAHRLADRRGLAGMRIDITEIPNAFLFSFGRDMHDAQERLRAYDQRRLPEAA